MKLDFLLFNLFECGFPCRCQKVSSLSTPSAVWLLYKKGADTDHNQTQLPPVWLFWIWVSRNSFLSRKYLLNTLWLVWALKFLLLIYIWYRENGYMLIQGVMDFMVWCGDKAVSNVQTSVQWGAGSLTTFSLKWWLICSKLSTKHLPSYNLFSSYLTAICSRRMQFLMTQHFFQTFLYCVFIIKQFVNFA